MATEIIEEIEAGGDVYLLHSKAMKNSNGTSSNTPYVYDWIGTQQEYNDQSIASTHPEWVCYITDDVEGGVSVYTKTEIDNAVVHKAGTETITGLKSIQNNGINLTNSNFTKGTAPSSTLYWGIRANDSTDSNTWANTRLGVLEWAIGSDNVATCTLNVIKNEAGSTTSSRLQLGYNTNTSTAYCNLPENTYATYFHGTADYAKWADLAEMYKTDKTYTPGTLIKFGGRKDITIAKDKCNGVISDKPGFVLDSGLEESLPIALVGKTPIRIIGKVKRFDPITLSETPGVGRVALDGEKIIGKTLEASDDENEKLIMCVTKFNLD